MTPANTIILGDCVNGMRNLAPASVDFVLTDPPYLVDYQSRDGRKVANDRNGEWLRPAFSQIYRVMKPASFCVSFYGWNRVHLSSWLHGVPPGFGSWDISCFANATPHPLACFAPSMGLPIACQG